ncbi:MAG: EF-P lysine aminoacylase GenX [Deltaproteobacteria bacterium]|nr:EF-P lysine aminoacylase GenX [Deltaproteobacteria bacterium]
MNAVSLDLLRQRAAVLRTVRRFFAERDYLEVETPVLVPCPGLDVHLDAFEVRAHDGAVAGYLSTSPEYQMKRLLCGGLERIFQVAHSFRSGERGHRHNPEFTMLEWYQVGASYASLMDETEALVRAVAMAHRGGSLRALGEVDATKPFARLTVIKAFELFAGVGRDEVLAMAAHDEERYFRLLVERVEPGLASLARPVFLHDYPAAQASLARRKPDDLACCERFELYVGDIELCNGFGELCDAEEQRARFVADQAARRSLGKPVYPLDEHFLADLERGMPACSGNALGLDRLVALVAGTASIGEVMAFSAERL